MEWIKAKEKPPSKNFPILVITEFCEMPQVVKWIEDGTYGKPGFFETNNEYETKEEAIVFWMPSPEMPTDKKSIRYFMCEMTQEEFEEWTKDIEKKPYKFNLINRPKDA